ncbi:MAG TPA: nucleoside 2-deoxyribosyltransferase [Rhodocyclaceae bacterium]|nr:nucleoside 2-deoxyribosyltransferase [Rhodocyclaceae bacterium]
MKLYLAGPDVFRPDALAWAEEARALCASFGHQALIPLDNEETTAQGIYRANLELIRAADGVVANLNPFRGLEPDSGTCVEVGIALALGKSVFGYLEDARPLAERVAATQGSALSACNGRPTDRDGLHVEDFGLPLNLMLAVPVRLVAGGLKDALAALTANRG